MAITYGTLFNFGQLAWQQDVAKGTVLTAATAQATFPGTQVATPEHETYRVAGVGSFGTVIAANGSIVSDIVSTIRSGWMPYAARYIRDNAAIYDGITTELGSFARNLIAAMIDDSATIDASAPSIGSPNYVTANQGGGTATIAVSGETATLKELLLAGVIELECVAAGMSIQGSERWVLRWRGVDPRSGNIITRTSASRNGTVPFQTGVRYFDTQATVYPGAGITPSARDIIPQTGGAIHTGLNILISAPSYVPTEGSGDVDAIMTAVSVAHGVNGASTLTGRNTTPAWSGATRSNTFYLRILKDGSNYNFTWYQDSGLTVALTNTIVLTTAAGTAVQTWTVAATNPESQALGGQLAVGANFISGTVAAGSLTQSATIDYTALLPWAVGDKITAAATNTYAGIYQRFFVEELGFPLPCNAAGGESIADPTA